MIEVDVYINMIKDNIVLFMPTVAFDTITSVIVLFVIIGITIVVSMWFICVYFVAMKVCLKSSQ